MVMVFSPLGARSVAWLAGLGGAGVGAWARRRTADASAIAMTEIERVIGTAGLSHGGFAGPARWALRLRRARASRCDLRRGALRACGSIRCAPGRRAHPIAVP